MARRPSKFRILIVDDDLFVTRALRRTLENSGFQVVCATTAVDAMCVLEEVKVSVVVSDQRMPGPSGTQLLEWCAANHPDVGRILLTAHLDAELASKAEDEGAYASFKKPWRNSALVPAVWSAAVYEEL